MKPWEETWRIGHTRYEVFSDQKPLIVSDDLTPSRANLIAAAPELYRALEACEYADNSDSEYTSRCPVCDAAGDRRCVDPGQATGLPPEAYDHPAEPHKPDCIVGLALRKARGEP